jgi:multiple sugar transport system substrate-binding protein
VVEIEFSYIWDNANDGRIWAEFMNEFGAKHGVKVHVREPMTWDNAWADLFSYASLGKAPHVSHIGSSWINSLARLNVLRPFKPDELSAIGGGWDFSTPNWDAGVLADDKRIWAIPWTTWTYVICYRKDLLDQVGIDPTSAFINIKAISETLHTLNASSLDIPWLNPQLPVSYRDLLHVAASWIWAAGGDFTDKDGRAVTFNYPEAIQGLKYWLETYRAVHPAYKTLSQPEIFDLFRQGHAAAVLANIHGANTFIDEDSAPVVREHIGVSPISQTPWTGGGSFVVWEHTRNNSQQEHAAIELIKFLACKSINIRYHNETYSMPSRIDALKHVYPDGNPIRDTIMQTATKGRHYYNIPLWRRIEQQLCEALGAIVNEQLNNPTANSETLLHQHLDPLARRLGGMIPQ